MMYMGTPRDYEFYVAIRILLKSLSALNVEADLVVIASLDVPLRWVRALWVLSLLTPPCNYYYYYFIYFLRVSSSDTVKRRLSRLI